MTGNVAVNPPNARLQKRLLRMVTMGSDFAPLADDSYPAESTEYPYAPSDDPIVLDHPPIYGLFDDGDIVNGDPRNTVAETACPLAFYRLVPPHREAPFLVYSWPGTEIDDTMSRDTGLFASDFSLMVYTPEGSDPLDGAFMLDTIWQRLRRNRRSTSWKRLVQQSGLDDLFVFNRYADIEPETRLLRDGLDVRVWWRAEENAG